MAMSGVVGSMISSGVPGCVVPPCRATTLATMPSTDARTCSVVPSLTPTVAIGCPCSTRSPGRTRIWVTLPMTDVPSSLKPLAGTIMPAPETVSGALPNTAQRSPARTSRAVAASSAHPRRSVTGRRAEISSAGLVAAFSDTATV